MDVQSSRTAHLSARRSAPKHFRLAQFPVSWPPHSHSPRVQSYPSQRFEQSSRYCTRFRKYKRYLLYIPIPLPWPSTDLYSSHDSGWISLPRLRRHKRCPNLSVTSFHGELCFYNFWSRGKISSHARSSYQTVPDDATPPMTFGSSLPSATTVATPAVGYSSSQFGALLSGANNTVYQ